MGVGQRPSDGNGAACERRLELMRQHAHRRLGRAVVIDDAAAGLQLTHGFRQIPVDGLAAEDQDMLRQHAARFGGLQQRPQMAGDDLENADPAARQMRRAEIRINDDIRPRQIERSAGAERAEQRRMAEIGRDARHHRHARVGRNAYLLQQALDIIGERAMADDDTLGPPRGAGCVDHIGGLPRQDVDLQRPGVEGRQCLVFQGDELDLRRAAGTGREAGQRRAAADDGRCAALRDELVKTRVGRGRIERNIGCARF